jgi:hypothetical protein
MNVQNRNILHTEFDIVITAIRTHLDFYTKASTDSFSYHFLEDGNNIITILLLFSWGDGSFSFGGDSDLGRIRIRRLARDRTELLISDSHWLSVESEHLLFRWPKNPSEPDETKRNQLAALTFKRLLEMHSEVREFLQTELRKDGLLGSPKEELPRAHANILYVSSERLDQLRLLDRKTLDLKRLIRMCEELNRCYSEGCLIAVGILVRAIIDHIPPIFDKTNFKDVAGQGSKSIKSSLHRLDKSSRDIADELLHQQIRRTETLPTDTRVNFSNDLDVLLAEIIRVISESAVGT